MKVLVFQGWVDPQGRPPEALLEAWPTLAGMAGALAAGGATVDVVVAGRHDARLERHGVAFRFVAERRLPRVRTLLGHRAAPHPRRSLAAASGVGADVVHLHGLSFPLQALALRRAHPDAVLVAQDHADHPVRGWRRRVHARGLARLDAVAFTHRELARPFVEAGVLPDDLPVIAVPEGSTTFGPGDRAAAREAAGVHGDPVVVWAGNLVADKDPFAALDAFAALEGGEARLWMAFRGGRLREDVAARAGSDPRLRGRVGLLGAVPHERMEPLLRAADVLLATSHREGGAYTVVEALACGTPVVATDIPAHRALLGPQPPGALVPVGDVRALAVALRDVTADRGRLGAAARVRFEAALSWAAVGRTLVAAYGDLLARGRARPS